MERDHGSPGTRKKGTASRFPHSTGIEKKAVRRAEIGGSPPFSLEHTSATACLGWALVAVIAAALGQYLTVRYNYEGHASALFFTGSSRPVPPPLAAEVYQVQDPRGFDGQFYHYIAHDPLMRRGFDQYVDNPRLRWRRILVPGLASVLSFGNSGWVDWSYFGVVLGFVFLGTYWVGRYLEGLGIYPGFALGFVALPGVFGSLERMTVDVALLALCAGFAVYASRDGDWKLYAVLALCPFARETGVLVAAGYACHNLLQRQWLRLVICSTSVAPYGVWVGYIHLKAGEDLTPWFAGYPFAGLVERTLNPVAFEITGRWVAAAAVADYLGILGTWAAIGAVVYLVPKKPLDSLTLDPMTMSCAAFVGLAAILGKADIWEQSGGFARVLSPLFLWLAMTGIARGERWMLAPLGLVVVRVGVQAWVHLPGIVRGVLPN